MNCPKCGSYCNDGAQFCTNCGAPLNASQSDQQQDSYQQGPNPYQQNPYQQPGYGAYPPPGYGAPTGGYHPPVKRRNIAVAIILSIVTCGIYGIYWMICLADDLNVASERPDDTSGGMVFLLTLVTCGIYSIYWLYKAGEKVAYIRQRNGDMPNSSNCVLYLVLGLFGLSIVDYCLIQSELNKVAALQ